jgi:FkbM family methyltransferase
MTDSLAELRRQALRLALGTDAATGGVERTARALAARADADELAELARLFSRAARIAPPPPPSSAPPLEASGEARVIRALAPFNPRIVFDVGANLGAWTALALVHWPECAVHGFEVVPATFEKYRARFAGEARVSANPFGLANGDGELDIHVYEGFGELASIAPFPHAAPSRIVRCPVRRGDSYAAERAIARIDYAKIDVEGAEHLVLEGLGPLLTQGAIEALQFEYGRVNILTHRLLIDFHFQLANMGYAIGRIEPEGVRFAPYSLDDEDFVAANFLAVRATRADMIAALGAPK